MACEHELKCPKQRVAAYSARGYAVADCWPAGWPIGCRRLLVTQLVCRVVVTCSAVRRGAKPIELKKIVDEVRFRSNPLNSQNGWVDQLADGAPTCLLPKNFSQLHHSVHSTFPSMSLQDLDQSGGTPEHLPKSAPALLRGLSFNCKVCFQKPLLPSTAGPGHC